MKIFYIYKITNLITNKIYIGQTKHSIEKRFKEHCSKSSKCRAIANSISKYGKENFKIDKIITCYSEEQANSSEKFCIRIFKSIVPNGYNLTDGGHNGAPSEETIEKLRLNNKNRVYTEEDRKLISERVSGKNNPMYGRKHTEETKKKISCILKEMDLPCPRKGVFGVYKLTEEQKIKRSLARKGVPNLKNRGKKRTEDFKKRRSEICTLQNQKKVINIETGEILPTAKLLVDILKMPYSTIINKLNGRNPNNTGWKYLI